ncbi:MAG: cation-transporting P-type ATPase [Candidatus Moranbacteria bacterium]|nr:cation-transporting P-type ATPase [Candidatus Moranbacteria bacterium]
MPKQIYNLSPAEVLKKFSTSEKGLSAEETKKRLKVYGRNIIEKKKSWRWAKLVGHQFNDALVWILLVAAGLALFFGEMRDVAIILVIVLINATIGFFQEWKAERILAHIQKLTSDKATVFRDGQKKEIDSVEIVPGDVIFVSSGDSVPADGYILESYNLHTNSFVFTGESKPEGKVAKAISEENLSVADVDNMVFSGEQVTMGEARAVVVGTGLNTELGKIANLATEVKDELTPLQKKMRTLGKDVTILAVAIAVAVMIAGSLYHMSLYQNFLFALAVAVAVVPEGLPAALSVALSLGMRRLLKVNVLAKKLIAVETLGSVNVICTDKTGTITKNELMVTKIILDEKEVAVSGEGYEPKGDFSVGGQKVDPKNVPNLELLLKIATLCNDAALVKEGNNFKIAGDPTEGALVVAARKYNPDEKLFERGERKIDENPFESERMRMSVVYSSLTISGEASDYTDLRKKKNPNYSDITESQKMVRDKNIFSYVKGSPDVLLGLSPKKLTQEGIVPFSDAEKEKTKKIYDQMSASALRVLAFAYRPLNNIDKEKYSIESERDLIWVGMMAMIDPPRKDVAEAIKECRESGIEVIMITGDYEVTARAIGKNVGLIACDTKHATCNNLVINGKELNSLSDTSIIRRIKDGASVFARIAPEQKLRVAGILKKSGAVIAMTGDGVNDAPALKRADIGVAMGIIGTDVSKEASDMILLDDNFASIVQGIKEGRTIYQNIRKFIYYVFVANAGEFLTAVFGALLFIPAPITAVQILAIDLGVDVLPSFALGLEPPEPGIMKKKPQSAEKRLIGALGFWRLVYVGMIMATGAVIAFLWSMTRGGWHFGEKIDFNSALYIKSTAATYAVLAMAQMANLLQARSETFSVFKIGFFNNKYIIGAILFSVGLLFAFLYIPFFQKNLHMAPLDLRDWLVVAGATLAVFLFEEARKAEEK